MASVEVESVATDGSNPTTLQLAQSCADSEVPSPDIEDSARYVSLELPENL